MRARFGGTCARTGRNYKAGAEIIKGASGWELAGSASSAYGEYVTIRLDAAEPGGEPVQTGGYTNQPIVCVCCKKLPGFDKDKPETYSQCVFVRTGNDLLCPNCGRKGKIVTKDDIRREAAAQTAAVPADAIRFSRGEHYGGDYIAAGTVMRNPRDESQIVVILDCTSQYIREDGMSFGVGDEEGYLYSYAARLATDEESAPLLASEAAQAERRALRDEQHQLFAHTKESGAEYSFADDGNAHKLQGIVIEDPDGKGFARWVIDGAGGYIWYCHNNSADGDCWADTNTSHGLGYRFPFDDARQAFMDRVAPTWRADLDAYRVSTISFESATSRLTATKMHPPSSLMTWNAWTNWPTADAETARAELADGTAVFLDRQTGTRYAPASVIDSWANEHYRHMAELRGEVDAAREVLRAIGRRAPAGNIPVDDYPWLHLIDRDGQQRYIDIATSTEWLIRDEYARYELPAAEVAGVEPAILTHLGRADIDPNLTDAVMHLHNTTTYPHFYRHPDGRLFASMSIGYTSYSKLIDISTLTEDDIEIAAQSYRNRATAAATDRKLEAIRKTTKRPEIAAVTSDTKIDEAEKSRGNSGTTKRINRLEVVTTDGEIQTLWLVNEGWWSMGEDGDADDRTTTYDDESAARSAYKGIKLT
jgi:hypothetical protein